MEKTCPITETISTLGKKWNLMILRTLNENSEKRFNELLNEVPGISSRTLSKRVKELEKAKLVKKTRFNETPPRVEYALTEPGRELIKCFSYLDKWVKKYK